MHIAGNAGLAVLANHEPTRQQRMVRRVVVNEEYVVARFRGTHVVIGYRQRILHVVRDGVERVVVRANLVLHEAVEIFYLVHVGRLPVVRAVDERVFYVTRFLGQIVECQREFS